MAIKDLQPRQGNVQIEADVIEKGDIREFEKFGKKGRVCNAVIKDATGQVKLSLWNEQIDTVNVGDKIKITNGWVSEWQGELQLTTGKFGKLEVVGKADISGDSPKEEKPSSDDEVEDAGIEEDIEVVPIGEKKKTKPYEDGSSDSEEDLDEEIVTDEEEIV